MTQSSTKPLEDSKPPEVGSQWVNSKYTLIHQLYEGMSSKIFVGAFMKNNRQVTRAIKIEPMQPSSRNHFSNKSLNVGIKNEISVLRHLFMNEYNKLDLKVGFPHMFEFGSERQFNYIVMSMYGPNLSQLMRLCGGKFSARTTLLIALQIVDRLEDIHQKKYLYGGICPQNFMVGINKQSYLIYMTDFAKSTIYKSKNKGIHIPYQNLSFDHVFMSVNNQLGVQASRRDDIESFMYLILYMFKGRLPWTYSEHGTYTSANNSNLNTDGPQVKKEPTPNSLNVVGSNNGLLQQQRTKILEVKRKISAESLFKCLSFELIDLMHYAKTLSFYEKPDYQYIRKKLWSALLETDYEELKNNVIIYDWNQREPLDYEIYRDSPKFKVKSEKDKENDEIVEQLTGSSKISEEVGRGAEAGKRNSHKVSIGQNKNERRLSSATSMSNSQQKQKIKGKSRHSLQSGHEKDKGEQKLAESEDDANVIDEEEDLKLVNTEANTMKIDEKLKIVNQIDEDQMSSSLCKENRSIKVASGQSRFKQSSE